jgi:hypothetical protein
MHSIQILLPLYNQEGEAFPKQHYIQLRNEFTEQFGGITIYTRSPATGFWKENDEKTVKDDIIIYEVMAQELDKTWWQSCRQRLEHLFRQDEIIIRTWNIELL